MNTFRKSKFLAKLYFNNENFKNNTLQEQINFVGQEADITLL
jgi:hypothetical protein